MLENLRRAFREAIENFRTELHRDDVPEATDALLRRMRSELTDTRAYLVRLREELERAGALAEAEAREAEICRRRERLALEIHDAETAEIARRFAERHEGRRDVLRKKAAALREELELRTRDLKEMEAKLREAQTRREDLVARSGRTSARSSIDATGDLFAELDRMAEKILDKEHQAEALDELLEEELQPSTSPRPAEREIEAKLAELKRRMGRNEPPS